MGGASHWRRLGRDWQGMHWIRDAKRAAIYLRDGSRCVWCGERGGLTLDHLVPVSQGGTHESKNLVTACLWCNSARQDRSVRRWLRWLERAGTDVEAVAARLEHAAEASIDYNERPCRPRKAVKR